MLNRFQLLYVSTYNMRGSILQFAKAGDDEVLKKVLVQGEQDFWKHLVETLCKKGHVLLTIATRGITERLFWQ